MFEKRFEANRGEDEAADDILAVAQMEYQDMGVRLYSTELKFHTPAHSSPE